MVITAETTYTYTLTGVLELREYDEAAEAYMPIPQDSRKPCAHCGKLCQRLYQVTRDQDCYEFLIGPGCARKSLFGWEPEKEIAKAMEKEADKLTKSRAHGRLVEIATPIAQEVAQLSIPEIVSLGTKYVSQIPVYGMVGSSAQVLCHEGLTSERKRCCIDAWKREQVRMRAEEVFPENTRKCQKLKAEVLNLLSI